MAQPIFLIGWRRSGTTWLGGLLSNNSNVASVQFLPNTQNAVLLESCYFSHLDGKYGNLNCPNNYIRFIEFFSSSAYFETTRVNKDILYKKGSCGYETIFRTVMDTYAAAQDKNYWLEKSPAHTFHIFTILSYYPDAKFIAITRDPVEQIRSAIKYLNLIGKQNRYQSGLIRQLKVLKEILAWCGAESFLRKFSKHHPEKIIFVRYEELVQKPKNVLKSICDFLNFTFEQEMLESPYKLKSSFTNAKERRQSLTNGEILLIRLLTKVFQLVPFIVYKMIYSLKRKILGQKLPFLFYLNKKNDYQQV